MNDTAWGNQGAGDGQSFSQHQEKLIWASSNLEMANNHIPPSIEEKEKLFLSHGEPVEKRSKFL